MALTGSVLPPKGEKAVRVEAMFDRIAPRYDLMNRLLTFRLDQSWRRRVIRLARLSAGDLAVDLGCGTGDLCELAAATGARVVGVDFSAGMLQGAQRRGIRSHFLRADAARIPVATASAAAVTSAFALRNFVDIAPVLRESARILAPGGRLVLLEVDEPRNPLLRWGHAFYFRRVVPFIGGLLSDRTAYAYLPQSTTYLPPDRELLQLMQDCGFTATQKLALSGGIAQILYGERRE